jgi:hypothetical protein
MDVTRFGKPMREMQNFPTKNRGRINMEMKKELDIPLLMAVVNKVNEEDKEALMNIIYSNVPEDKHDDVYQLAYLMLEEVEDTTGEEE